MKKLVIFDLDGTLFDTTEAMAACGNYALAKMGLPLLTPHDYARISGVRTEEFSRGALLRAGENPPDRWEEFWAYYLGRNEAGVENANVPYEGIPVLLSALKERGVRIAVLSNKDEESCIPIVEGAFGKDVFDVIRGQRPDTPPKPDPAGALRLLRELGARPEECLYVGDTEVDMKTGKNAALPTVAVLWGYREKEELAAFDPEFVISRPEELLSLVDEI